MVSASCLPTSIVIKAALTPPSTQHPSFTVRPSIATTTKMADQTISLPQLVFILLLSGLAIRFFFFSTSSGSQTRSSNSANNVRAREADVERIQQMFPQVSRRSIMWDLQRNGGNVVATTERILSGRGLEVVCSPRWQFGIGIIAQAWIYYRKLTMDGLILIFVFLASAVVSTSSASSCLLNSIHGSPSTSKATSTRLDHTIQPQSKTGRGSQ